MLKLQNTKLLVGIMLALLAALLAIFGSTTPAAMITILILGIILIATSRKSIHFEDQ